MQAAPHIFKAVSESPKLQGLYYQMQFDFLISVYLFTFTVDTLYDMYKKKVSDDDENIRKSSEASRSLTSDEQKKHKSHKDHLQQI